MHYKKDLAEKIKMKGLSLKRYFGEQHFYGTISGAIIVGGIIILLCVIFCGSVDIFTGDAKSAINLFSALSASLAAIFAIFFTIPLIALQLVASKYTTKAYDFFFDLWTKIYMFIFICSIIFSFLTLGWIGEGTTAIFFRAFNSTISVITLSNVGIILSGMLLLLLIPYLFRTLEKLKPENLIKEVEDRGIKMNAKFGKATSTNKEENEKEKLYSEFKKGVIDVLSDITIGAVVNKDASTFRRGIRGWLNLYLSVDVLETSFDAPFHNSFRDVILISGDESETIVMESITEIYVFIWEGFFKSQGIDLKEKIDSKRAKKAIKLIKGILPPEYDNPKYAEKAFEYLCNLGERIIGAMGASSRGPQSDSIREAKATLKEIIEALHGENDKIDRIVNALLSSNTEIADGVIEEAVNAIGERVEYPFILALNEKEKITIDEKLCKILDKILFPERYRHLIKFSPNTRTRIANHIIQKIYLNTPDFLRRYRISEENLAMLLTIGAKSEKNMKKVKEKIEDKIRNELRGERDLLERAFGRAISSNRNLIGTINAFRENFNDLGD